MTFPLLRKRTAAPSSSRLISLAALVAVSVVGVPSAYAQETDADPSGDFSIVNGQLAEESAIPTYAQLIYAGDGKEMHDCGATVLDRDWVMTAAHCVWDTPTSQEEGKVVTHHPSVFKVYHPATKELRGADQVVVPDATYAERWRKDIALVKLREPLSTAAQMTLPTAAMPIVRSGHGVVWGKGQHNQQTGASIAKADYTKLQLRKAQVPINKPEFCGNPTYGKNLLCAEAPSQHGTSPASCVGDSGGPLTLFSDDPKQQIQLGVVSHTQQVPGRPFCGGQPTWYTPVNVWANWIKDQVPGAKFGTFSVNPSTGVPVAPVADLPSCGEVNHPGSAVPTANSAELAWVPVRGPKAGSAVSLAASGLTWPAGKQADYAVLAGECAWSDALAATSLTSRGPLLLNDGNGLEPEVLQEITRLGVKQVIVVGGHQAVGAGVVTALEQAGVSVRRVSGPSRVETAANVAKVAKELNPSLTGVLVARAYPESDGSPSQAFADSLAAAYVAPRTGAAVVLSATDTLSPATASAVTELKPRAVGLLGGSKALGAKVENRVRALVGKSVPVQRFAGKTRDDTARLVGESLATATGGAKGVMVIDGHANDAWKVGFTFGNLAATDQNVYALANGDQLSPESAALIKQAKTAGLPIRCVAAQQACTAANAVE